MDSCEQVAVGTIAQVHRATLHPRPGLDLEGVGRQAGSCLPIHTLQSKNVFARL